LCAARTPNRSEPSIFANGKAWGLGPHARISSRGPDFVRPAGDPSRWCSGPRAGPAAENLFLRKQLACYLERQVRPYRTHNASRIALVALSRLVEWRDLLTIVRPDVGALASRSVPPGRAMGQGGDRSRTAYMTDIPGWLPLSATEVPRPAGRAVPKWHQYGTARDAGETIFPGFSATGVDAAITRAASSRWFSRA
jgi:hypothetical protein